MSEDLSRVSYWRSRTLSRVWAAGGGSPHPINTATHLHTYDQSHIQCTMVGSPMFASVRNTYKEMRPEQLCRRSSA